ncbi:hypothetical protein HDU97_010132 [Phlyctochytrium planicorne]|nr:hypothetical protein HDU97_010132 [Phlyctochytrium planicorne]
MDQVLWLVQNVYGAASSLASKVAADPALSISVTAAALTVYSAMRMGLTPKHSSNVLDVEIGKNGSVARKACIRKFKTNTSYFTTFLYMPWSSATIKKDRPSDNEKAVSKMLAFFDNAMDKIDEDPIHPAVIAQDPASLPWKLLVNGIITLFGAISSTILGDWGPVSTTTSSSNLPPVDDKVAILSAFHTVLDQTSRLVPDHGIIVFEGCESLLRLARTEVGYQAINLFLTHLMGLSRRRGISVILVSSPAFVHHLLLPLAATEAAAILPFSDLGKDEAKDYFLEQLRIHYGVYHGNASATTPTTHPSSTTPSKPPVKFEDAWAINNIPTIDLATDHFDIVHEIVGGRAADLVACASILSFSEPYTVQPLLPLGPQEAREHLRDRLHQFPDMSASIRWLEEKLSVKKVPKPDTDKEQEGDEKAISPNIFPLGLQLGTFDPNPTPEWTLLQAVALLDALVASPHGFVTYTDAIQAIRNASTISCAEQLDSIPRSALSSMILHDMVAYRPQGILYFDGTGSKHQDGVAAMRPLHLYAYKSFVRPKLVEVGKCPPVGKSLGGTMVSSEEKK